MELKHPVQFAESVSARQVEREQKRDKHHCGVEVLAFGYPPLSSGLFPLARACRLGSFAGRFFRHINFSTNGLHVIQQKHDVAPHLVERALQQYEKHVD